MSLREHVIVPERLSAFDVFRVHDAGELDTRSSISERFPATGRLYKYQLRERALWRTRFEQPIFGMATRSAGAILVSFGNSRFATDRRAICSASPCRCTGHLLWCRTVSP